MRAGGYRGAVVGAVLVVVVALGGVPIASGGSGVASGGDATGDGGNEAPLADAGLDQTVPVNATVYLDASGSRDPDGSIASYEWSIERPDGDTIEPACGTCARTEFLVTMAGTYEVTVTVTDDDGATSTDTLYVRANAVEGPSVTVTGPQNLTANVSTTYTARAEAGASPLARLEWAVDGSERADRAVDGESATEDLAVGLAPGNHTLRVRVVSEMGRTATATLTVEVAGRPPQPCASAVWNGTSGRWNTEPCDGDGGGGGGTTDTEDCYNAQSARAEAWERAHPTKEFACNNDVWFGGQSPSIVNTDEDGDFTAMGVSASMSQARRWTNHSDVSLETDTGFKRLNFHTQAAWRNAKKVDNPWGEEDGNEDPPERDPPEEEPGEGPENCENIPPRYRPPSCTGSDSDIRGGNSSGRESPTGRFGDRPVMLQ